MNTDNLQRGLQLHRRGRYPGAILRYRRALRRQPDSALAHYLLGLALMSQGEQQSAQAEWDAAVRATSWDEDEVWARRHAAALLDQVAGRE